MAKAPERANLVARLPGGDGPTLALIAHTDTVVADAEEWERDPWSGDLVDGEVWGRGALDMKGHVAAAAVAFASLAREGLRPAGDVVLALTADEEVNLDFGLSWLVRGARGPRPLRLLAQRERRRAVRVRRQGLLPLRRRREDELARSACTCAVAAGTPRCRRSRTTRSSRRPATSRRSAATSRRKELLPEVRQFLEVVLGEVPPLEDALARARALHPLAAELVEPLLSLTLSPTMIEASRQRNVIPGRCTITVDCRLLPGADAAVDRAAPPCRARRRALGARVDPRGSRRRHVVAARHAALARAGGLGRARRAGRPAGADHQRRLHGQPLAAGCLRDDRLRVLPAQGDGRRARRRGWSTRRTSASRSRTSSWASTSFRARRSPAGRGGAGSRLSGLASCSPAAAASARTSCCAVRTRPAGIDLVAGEQPRERVALVVAGDEPQRLSRPVERRVRERHPPVPLVRAGDRDLAVAYCEHRVSGTREAVWPSAPRPRWTRSRRSGSSAA